MCFSNLFTFICFIDIYIYILSIYLSTYLFIYIYICIYTILYLYVFTFMCIYIYTSRLLPAQRFAGLVVISQGQAFEDNLLFFLPIIVHIFEGGWKAPQRYCHGYQGKSCCFGGHLCCCKVCLWHSEHVLQSSRAASCVKLGGAYLHAYKGCSCDLRHHAEDLHDMLSDSAGGFPVAPDNANLECLSLNVSAKVLIENISRDRSK